MFGVGSSGAVDPAAAAHAFQSPAAAPADPSAIDPRLRSLAARDPHARAEVIVQFQAGLSGAERRQLAVRAGARQVRELHIIPGLAARMTGREAVELGHDARVHAVSLNAAIKPQSIPTTNLQTTFPKSRDAANAWNKRDNSGVTGKGVGVAVIDTGVAGDLVDFQGADGNSRVVE